MAELFVVITALCLGSFANVFIYRYPKGESVVTGASHCPHCGRAIRFYHNIPLVSWFWLRGKCTDCKAPIPFRYWLVEFSFGLVASAVVLRFGVNWYSLFFLSFFLMLTLIAWVDWETLYIFDVTTFPLLGIGLFASVLFPQLYGHWWSSAVAECVLFIGMALLAWFSGKLAGREAMGGGDIKLMAACAGFLGISEAWKALFYAAFIGVPVMLFYLKLKKRNFRDPAPYGPTLALGSFLAAWNMISGGDLNKFLDTAWLWFLKAPVLGG
jgi:leader peptidase (prepilin peptidase) / N-methyltransferase